MIYKKLHLLQFMVQ